MPLPSLHHKNTYFDLYRVLHISLSTLMQLFFPLFIAWSKEAATNPGNIPLQKITCSDYADLVPRDPFHLLSVTAWPDRCPHNPDLFTRLPLQDTPSGVPKNRVT